MCSCAQTRSVPNRVLNKRVAHAKPNNVIVFKISTSRSNGHYRPLMLSALVTGQEVNGASPPDRDEFQAYGLIHLYALSGILQ